VLVGLKTMSLAVVPEREGRKRLKSGGEILRFTFLLIMKSFEFGKSNYTLPVQL